MKKSGLLVELERIKLMAADENNSQLIGIAIIEALLEYGNDPQIRAAVDAIPF